ncbi:MAG: amidase, partial [Acidobacteria bacterium]|nr:amidase [Acidobacteriota bacterium]
ISRLRAAGAIVIGNTNVPEFLMAYETDNRLQGRTSNPWDLSRTSGGSSGGESAAIAAGCSAGGVGSDGGGSIRVPAHFCGICGLKPTPGRVPGTGHFPVGAGPFAWLGVVGPMARSVGDLQILFQVMAGPDDGDPLAAPIPLQQISEESVRKIRVGFFIDDGLAPVTAETRAAVHTACDALKSAGFEVAEFLPKNLLRVHELWWTVFGRMVYMVLEPGVAGRDADLSPILREYLSVVREETPLTASSFLNILLERDAVRASFLQQMNEFPILICPVSASPANLHGAGTWTLGRARAPWREGMRFSQWFNLLGLPAAVVPVGKSSEGLPIGVQIIGKPFQEMAVLAVAAQIESASTRGLWQQPAAI